MKMYQVDAFTQQLFRGNPAAVMVLEQEWLSDEFMQNIALENQLSETAFVKVVEDGEYEIRWFSPIAEVDFCGHATLASSFVIFNDYTDLTQIKFHVRNLGEFIVAQAADGKIIMNFPIRRALHVEDYPVELRQGLTKPFVNVYRNEQAFIVEYATVQDVLDEQPNVEFLRNLTRSGKDITFEEGLDVAITAAGAEYDCVSRYFAPSIGIEEDAVTGSIHTAIAPLWADKLGKNDIAAYQASSRGGELSCQILNAERIEISGYAKLYMIAEVFL